MWFELLATDSKGACWPPSGVRLDVWKISFKMLIEHFYSSARVRVKFNPIMPITITLTHYLHTCAYMWFVYVRFTYCELFTRSFASFELLFSTSTVLLWLFVSNVVNIYDVWIYEYVYIYIHADALQHWAMCRRHHISVKRMILPKKLPKHWLVESCATHIWD